MITNFVNSLLYIWLMMLVEQDMLRRHCIVLFVESERQTLLQHVDAVVVRVNDTE